MPTKTVLETLEAARKRLSQRGAWGKGWFAFDKNGNHISSRDENACRWCALGAINSTTEHMPTRFAAAKMFTAACGDDITRFNDKAKNKKVVLAAFDAAIAKAKAEGK